MKYLLQNSTAFEEMLRHLNGDLNVGLRYFGKLKEETVYTGIIDDDSLAAGKPQFEKVVAMRDKSYHILTDIAEVEVLKDATNVYFTPNTINSWKSRRINENVQYLTCIWQDIDSCRIEEALAALESSGLPEPTYIINSGGGVHLYWNLVFKLPAASYYKSWLTVMQAVKTRLSEALPVGSSAIVDSSVLHGSRYMRVPSSFNGKRGVYSGFYSIKTENNYNFLEDFYNPLVKVTEQKKVVQLTEYTAKKNKTSGTSKWKNSYNQYLREDIVRLVHLRSGNMEGHRHNLLLYLKLLRETDSQIAYVNSLFNCPLVDYEVTAIQKANYTNFVKRSTIYEGLAVTEEEERQMKVLTNEHTARVKKELTRNLSAVSAEVNSCIQLAKDLYMSNYISHTDRKQREAAAFVGCGYSTAKRYKQKDMGDFMSAKQTLFNRICACAADLLEALILLAEDRSTLGHLDQLTENAEMLSTKVETLKQLIQENEELQGEKFRVNILEEKCVRLWNLAA